MDNSDDSFSDDGLESLPVGTLLQLEQDAYQATQVRRQASEDPSVIAVGQHDVSGPLRNRNDVVPISGESHTLVQRPFSSEFRDLDLGELDAEILDDDSGSNNVPGSHPFARSTMRRETTTSKQDHAAHDFYDASHTADDVQSRSPQTTSVSAEIERLKVCIEELTQKHAQAMEELKIAKSNAETKAGEAAIIRTNQAKLTREHDRQISALRKAIADEVARHKEEIAAARAESTRIATENAFLKQDLADETHRLSKLKTKAKPEEKAPPLTPKKARVLPFRDGFNDDEMAVLSPSKSSGGRSKRGTPVVAGKRKRKLSMDSPIPMASLQLSPAQDLEASNTLPQAEANLAAAADAQTFSDGEGRNLRFMKWILNHRTPPNKERDIEVMSKLAFPSEPDRKFSSIVLDETASLRSGNYPVQFASSIVSLWSRALDEKYYMPIYLFMGVVNFILLLDAPEIQAGLIPTLVPVLQLSAEVNGVPRFKSSPVFRQNLGQIRQTPRSELHPEVDSTDALENLQIIASSCQFDQDISRGFWQKMRYDFVLTMLNNAQLIDDITAMLSLLSTSIRPESFGPIADSEQQQRTIEDYLIDRVANLFFEVLQVDEGTEEYLPSQVCEMRLEALSFLEMVAFAGHDPKTCHGNIVIAEHPVVLAKLTRSLHDEMAMLYSYTPEHDLHTSLVNGLMHLIYGVVSNHPDVDLHSKLNRVADAPQKYLVVLTRLAFSEGEYFEAGISEDTVEMAHEMLENSVNPEEAEALIEAFPSARRDDS